MRRPRPASGRLSVALVLGLSVAGCFQTRLDLKVRATGSAHGTAELRLPRRLATDPQFRAALQPGGGIVELWTSRGARVAADPDREVVYAIRAPRLDALDLPWQRHAFAVEPGTGRFSYVGSVSLPTEALRQLQAYTVDAARFSGKLGPKAALTATRVAEEALATAYIELRLAFPGEVTLTNGADDGDALVWRWPLRELAEGESRLALAAGSVPAWAVWRDRLLDFTGL